MPSPPKKRAKHPDKDLERVLRDAETQSGGAWRVERDKGYYKMWCPCPDKHKKTVKLTPSDPHYEKNLRAWLRRMTCWKEDK